MKLIFLYKTVLDIFFNISNVSISKNVQNNMRNLPIRLAQFTGHKKKGKKYQLAATELSVNDNTTSPQI